MTPEDIKNHFEDAIPKRKIAYSPNDKTKIYPISADFVYQMDLFSMLKMQGVYFLFNDEDIEPIYIGKSKYIGSRIRQHYNAGYGRQFKYFIFFNMDEYDFNSVEKLEIDLIRKLKPKQNLKVI